MPQTASMAQMPGPAFCSDQYSSLHQKRLYLLSALAEEEDRGERLTRAFKALNAKLKDMEVSEPQRSTRKLKQTIGNIRDKTGKCQLRERALAANLANVVAQMEGLKRYQWRLAEHNYSQQFQHGQMMMMMSPGFPPGFALQSPMNTDLASNFHYLSLAQPMTPRYQQQYQQPYPVMNSSYPTYSSAPMPPMPVIVPTAQYQTPADTTSVHAASPADTYTYSEIEELAEAISPCDLSSLGILQPQDPAHRHRGVQSVRRESTSANDDRYQQ